jgi:Na+/H+ antiporter NhaA
VEVSAADFPVEPGESEAEVETEARSGPFAGRTAWARNLEAPLRDFLRTETGSAAILLIGAVAAMVWINADASSYGTVWHTLLSVRIGDAGVSQDLRHWVNDGLMTLFFFVVGLEARREFDLGDLRDRRRLILPFAAGIGGMLVPIAIFPAINAGGAPRGAWGAAMSTDTAFALGMLALVGSRYPSSLRAFILTVAVVDDLVALVVIAIAFTGTVHAVALAVGITVFILILVLRSRGVHNGGAYLVLGLVAWVAFLKSGIDPIVVGLAMGLLTIAYPAAREDLERATDLFRVFREQPTSELQQSARAGLRSAISPNERFQQMFHPFTSYVIVPLFALANAGFIVNGDFLGHAYGSAITLGIIAAYVVGKPIGVTGAASLVTKLSHGRVRPPVGWVSVLGGGAVAGIGFTVSLLIASLAFSGQHLAEAKLGIITTLVAGPAMSWAIICVTYQLPKKLKARLLIGRGETIIDLAAPVDPERDHIRGPDDAPVTLVEYGDLECPYCGQAEDVIRELLSDFGGELRYVWRHLPLNDVHPHAQLAAEASEAAGAQGKFWEMHDMMLAHQDQLTLKQIVGHAQELALDIDAFKEHLRKRKGAAHIAEDVESADMSGVSGTPSFFINGHRHQDAYDIDTLSKAVRTARVRAAITA